MIKRYEYTKSEKAKLILDIGIISPKIYKSYANRYRRALEEIKAEQNANIVVQRVIYKILGRRMGKVTGFLELDRQDRKYRPAADRVRNLKSFFIELPEQTLQSQASRCMDCGIPFVMMLRV